MAWLIYALLAVACGSARELLQKKALQAEHTLEFLVVRGFFMILISLFLLPFVHINLTWQAFGWILVVAILVSIAVIKRNTALKHEEMSLIEPLLNVNPVFVLVIAFIFLGESVTWMQLGGILLLVAGTYILEADHEYKGLLGPFKHLMKSKYAVMVVTAGIILSVTNTLDRFILTNFADPLSYLFLLWLCINMIFFLYHAYKYNFKGIPAVLKNHGFRIFWPALLSILMLVFFYKAMSMAYASLVVAVYRLESLATTMVGGRTFHEKHLRQKEIACAIMTIGAILVAI